MLVSLNDLCMCTATRTVQTCFFAGFASKRYFFWILCLIDFINVSISNLYVYVYLYTRTVTHSFTHPFLLNAHILHSHTRAHIQRISNWIAFGVLENPQAQTTWKLTFLSVLLFHSFTFPANKKKKNERTNVSDI